MDIVITLWNYFVHLDEHLQLLIQNYGLWTYLILFVIIFMETGFVVTPFLPGDSLLFAVGAVTAGGVLNIHWLYLLMITAAITGDSINYAIGNYIGPRVFHENVRFLKREYLDRTHEFYETHGGKTILLARFIPIIRTFAPFVAGVGKMSYSYFLSYNIIGGVLWVTLFIFGGFYFGKIPFVAKNFEFVILAIIFISMLPPIFEYLKERRKSK